MIDSFFSDWLLKQNDVFAFVKLKPERLCIRLICSLTTACLCDRLIIDTFPRGLGGELADILPQLQHIPRILIHRDINPRYITAKNLRSFVAENFDAIIVPGEGKDLAFCDLANVHHTAPWLIRSDVDLPERTKTRSHKSESERNYKNYRCLCRRSS